MNQLAVSLAGHDKGKIYAVTDEKDGVVYLADGSTRKIAHPKCKNKKHVRKIISIPPEIAAPLGDVRQDSDLVHVLRLYQAYQKEKQESDTEGNEVKRCQSQM